MYFYYQKERGNEGPLEILNSFEGYLQTYDYRAYP
ncbi:hypothetical protein [Flavobacterium sp. 9]